MQPNFTTRARPLSRSHRVLLLVVVAAVVVAGTAAAQQPAPTTTTAPANPFAPTWAMLSGADVFAAKGCGKCHAVRGMGGGVGPDLARMKAGTGFYDIGAAMWNHLPKMGAMMRREGAERPRLTAKEATDVIAFLFTAQYWDEAGDPKAGERLFTSKACVQCHSIAGKGGNVGPPLDALNRANSPVIVAAAMWNHGPAMAEMMKSRGIARPRFEGKELIDLIAYIRAGAGTSPAPTETTQVVPGTPERGEKLFGEKHCASCHAVGGKGGKVGPDLGRSGHHLSLTRFAARMWNHGPRMATALKQRGLEVPKLSGQDMADILAHLYVSHYFDPRASTKRGVELIGVKGCTRCHSVKGVGGKVAADFAGSSVVGTPGGLVAGMWNHATLMEASAQAQNTSWPVLQGAELADIAAYLASLNKPNKPRQK